MEIGVEKLPFPAMAFHHWGPDDREMGVAIVKGTFGIRAGHKAYIARDQDPLLLEDVFAGDPTSSSLLREQEIAPVKIASDLTVHATARAPEGIERRDWSVSITIPDRVHHGFQVFGARQWRRERRGWSLSEPEPMVELPIRYEHAYGGAVEGDVFEENPVGCGRTAPEDDPDKMSAPRIAELGETQAAGRGTWSVRGFGPIAKTWLPCRSFAGTFDEDWLSNRHPRMPPDYSFEFWQNAPSALQIRPFLEGNETIELRGVAHEREPYRFALPGPRLEFTTTRPDGGEARFTLMALDTCHIDIDDRDQEKHRLTLVWRAIFADPQTVRSVIVRTRRSN